MNVYSVSFILASYNTFEYFKLAYNSIRKYYPSNEIIVLDDGSDDGSWEWIQRQKEFDSNLMLWRNTSGKIIGHTCTYNRGVIIAKNPIVTIFHSDMI